MRRDYIRTWTDLAEQSDHVLDRSGVLFIDVVLPLDPNSGLVAYRVGDGGGSLDGRS